jgi:hypothetical protein
VQAPLVVELHPHHDAKPRLEAIGIGFEEDILVLQRSPQPLDEHIIHPAAASIRGNRRSLRRERPGEGFGSELRALVCVEYLRLAEPREGLPESRETERSAPSCWRASTTEPLRKPSR